jgi:hypothetical protein
MVWPAIIGAASALGTTAMGKFFADEAADDAWDRNMDAYGRRYQMTMADMKAAGLNPILAAGSGGFNVGQSPIAPQAHLPNIESATSAYKAFTEGQKTEEQTKTEKVEQLKKMAETKSEIAKRYKIRAETGKVSEEERRIWFEIEKRHSDTILNMKTGFKNDAEKRKMQAQVKQLNVELQRLKNVDRIYQNPASMALSIIREIANSLGLNVGIVGKAGK